MTPPFVELLAPAKNLEIAKAAILAGADAVYIGAQNFGARSAAANSLEDIKKAVEFAHFFHARIFVTLNTIVYDNEINAAQKLAFQLYDIGVDALIIQDFGLLEIGLPPIPIHASTQTNNQTPEKVQFLQKAGLDRVVLARELDLAQISNIAKLTNVELEYFVHGALCVSYSGQCYLSAAIGGRSGNRGECAQACRLKFDFTDSNGKPIAKQAHHLSIKDLNNSNALEQIMKAGVSSLKIEGRLKDQNYVVNIVSFYRNEIDKILAKNPNFKRPSVGKSIINFTPNPNKTFNRGFSNYFLNGRKPNIYADNSPKSMGEFIGIVKQSKPGQLVIQQNTQINNGDGISYTDVQGNLQGVRINKAEGNTLFLHKKISIPQNTKLFRNSDTEFDKQLQNNQPLRKIEVHILFSVKKDHIHIQITDESDLQIEKSIANDFDIAKNEEMARQNIQKAFNKTGDSFFWLSEIAIHGDTLPFIPNKKLNELRAEMLTQLADKRAQTYKRKKVIIQPTEHDYPNLIADYSENISNTYAVKFYQKHGATVQEKAPEITNNFEQKKLMTTKMCLKYKAGFCPRYNDVQTQNNTFKEPFFLTNNKIRLRLEFNCKNCEMNIYKA